MEATACCVICKIVVSCGQEKKRRKKLYGRACAISRAVLIEEVGSLDQFQDSQNLDSLLCHSCDSKLRNISEMKLSLAQARKEMHSYLDKFQRKQSSCEKRSGPSLSSSPKRSRLECNQEREAVLPGCSSGSEPLHPVQHSPGVSVKIEYASGPQTFVIKTPTRKTAIKQYTRHSYHSLATTVMQSPSLQDQVLRLVARNVRTEMQRIASAEHDSILRDTVQAVKQFSWETVVLEMEKEIPTLMRLLRYLVKKPAKSRPLLCCLASQLLKDHHPKLGLMQRVVSVLMYGNGVSKQVFNCLQPLNISMSYTGMLKTMKNVSEDHDIEVQYWSDYLKASIGHEQPELCISQPVFTTALPVRDSSDEDRSSASAPAYSPVSGTEIASSSSPPSSSSSSELAEAGSYHHEDQQFTSVACDVLDETTSADQQQSTFVDTWNGFKIVGDNIDKNIRPSFQRAHHHTKSLHYFHSYAVKDRVDLGNLSDEDKPPSTVDPDSLLMSDKEWDTFKDTCATLISRILVENMEEFKAEAREVVWHIPSKFHREMSKTSEVVPLGVLLYNENKLEDMASIIETYQKSYIPTQQSVQTLILPNGSTRTIDTTRFFCVLFGGDQLTVARARSTAALRRTHDRPQDKLKGMVPVIEDWHARLTLMKVIWKRLFSGASTTEKGTMYQLRNLLNLTSVPLDPQKDMKASEDYLLLLLHGHAITAARTIIQFNPDASSSLAYMVKSIVNTYLLLPGCTDNVGEDGVNIYARELLTLALLWHSFHDATREGDGDRLVLCWKVMLHIFKITNRKNYYKESVNFLLQCNYFSPRKAAQLLWSRCINTKGKVGSNVPCDLVMEHMNRRLKNMLHSLGANITPSAIVQAGKALSTVHHVCMEFEEETCSSTSSHSLHAGVHNTPAFAQNLSTVVNILSEENAMIPQEARQHPTFKFKEGLLQKYSKAKLRIDIQRTITSLLSTYKF